MHHFGPGLVKRLQPDAAQPEGKVRILVIRRRVFLIEPAGREKHLPPHHQRRTGTIIDLPQIVEFRRVRIGPPTVIPGRRIVPQNAPGFLQFAVVAEQFGAGQP